MPEALQTLGRYQLLDRISTGGMAEVFRAKALGDVGFEKVVAIKCILPHMADDREFVDMFIDEARTVAQLTHNNICQIFEFGEEGGIYYIALELVEGKDLKRVMEYHRVRGRPIPMPEALYVMRRTCEALDYAHNCRNSQGQPMNIVHRDISPQNVLVSYGGDVKLIDFGIAKTSRRAGEPRSRAERGALKTTGRLTETVAGSITGKFGYMSPEQVSGKPVDLRSDIFACGTVLWELLTNTRLFKAETDLLTMQMGRRAEIAPPSSVNPAVPPALDHIVLHALARDPAHRYQNAGELLDDLERFIVDSGNSCSSQHLARWMNDVFEQDRIQAEQRQRLLAASIPLTQEGPEAP